MFCLSIIFVIFSFVLLIASNAKFEKMQLAKKYHPVVRMVMRECHDTNTVAPELQNELKNLNFSLILDESQISQITQNGDQKLELGKMPDIFVKVVGFEKFNYISIKTPTSHFLLKDNNQTASNSLIIFLIFGFVILCFIFAFTIIIKKLYPILNLTKKVQNFGNEKFDFDFKVLDKKDEISVLANEFQNSANRLKQIKEARNIFIRNIMHEFKTPITKGKFLLELPYSLENRAIMEKVFYRLEGLIDEFASIEELMSVNTIVKKSYFISDLIDNAIDLLIDVEEQIDIDLSDYKIFVDFKLFSIALKNLIDNSIKYCDDKKIKIVANENFIEIRNKGEKLKFPLEYYFEPFKKESLSSTGFGLGIYITNYILKAHDFKFDYIYEDGLNKFFIHFK